MRRPKTFLQDRTMMTTCGVCCAMMALQAFGIGYPSRGREKQLYARLNNGKTPGTTAAAIAYYLSGQGLEVSLRYSSPYLIDNYGWYYTPAEYSAEMEDTLDYLSRECYPFEMLTGTVIDGRAVRQELQSQHLVILQCFVEGDAALGHDRVPHAILLCEVDDNVFQAIDPLQGRIVLTETELETLMESPIGRVMISIGERQKQQKYSNESTRCSR